MRVLARASAQRRALRRTRRRRPNAFDAAMAGSRPHPRAGPNAVSRTAPQASRAPCGCRLACPGRSATRQERLGLRDLRPWSVGAARQLDERGVVAPRLVLLARAL